MLLISLILLPMVLSIALHALNRPKLQQCATMLLLALALVGTLGLVWLGDVTISLPIFGGNGIGFTAGSLGGVYAVVATVLWLVSAIVSADYFPHNSANLRRYYAALLFTYGATLGVFLATDLFTLFACFELMSFASYLWVIHGQNNATTVAGESYLTFAVCGGLTMLFGLGMLYVQCPDLTIATLSQNFPTPTPWVILAAFLLFIGFAIKAGVFFLHDWLPLAYTAAPSPATALLTGVLSKLGIYGIIIVAVKLVPASTAFTYFLLVLALCNMLGGAVFAFLSGDLKQTLSFSSISQIGFILWGIAMTNLLGHHGAIAVYGTIFYMISHSLAKILLFSITAIVEQTCHTTNLNAIMGFGTDKPWLKVTFAIGGLSLAGVPLLSGYVSKTLLHEAMSEYIALNAPPLAFTLAEWGFLVAGGFTLAYMSKLFVCLFVKNGLRQTPLLIATTKPVKTALCAIAVLLVVLGVSGNVLFAAIGDYCCDFFAAEPLGAVSYFSLTNLLGSATSITIGVLVYVFGSYLFPQKDGVLYRDLLPHLSFQDLVYKPVYQLLVFISAIFLRLLDILVDGLSVVFQYLWFHEAKIPPTFFHGEGPKKSSLRTQFHLSYSLAYSLLMFGLGFLFTIIYLLVVGSS
ncbi:proton-conducting transporter membrane subunit [Bengtsoniella intestinalis]|uniref:complex I subunit 5 family protein n=1 Tax=Bengtsoniella intestinalis TaxID=3073143 RepID=UPI00391F4FAA